MISRINTVLQILYRHAENSAQFEAKGMMKEIYLSFAHP